MIAAASLSRHNPNPAIRTGTPFVRVRVGSTDVWESGDGRLIECSMTLAEGKNNSSCEFTILDQTRQIANRYFEIIYKNDGLDPLTLPQPRNNNRNNTISSRGAGGGTSTNLEDLSVNMRAMLDTIAWAEGADYNVAFTGATFDGYDDHPRQIYCSGELCSDASGRYQFLSTTWDSLGLSDFSPENQDRGAVQLIEGRGVTAAVEAGRIQEALEGYGDGYSGLAYEWASLPPYRYPGQGTKSTADITAYWEGRVQAYGGTSTAQQTSQATVQSAQENRQRASTSTNTPSQAPTKAKVGQQITIEMGFDGQTYIAASFLHQSLAFDLFGPSTLTFGGQAASYVLARRLKNTAYSDITLKQLAQQICEQYGLTLDMFQDGPTYEYIPQRGISDYELLLSLAREIGWRIRSVGNTLTIAPRSETIIDPGFVLVYGENLGTTFRVTHSAQGDSGGARASDPSDRSTSGQRKWAIDESGRLVQVQAEVDTGTTSASSEQTSQESPTEGSAAGGASTGHHISTLGTVVQRDDPNSAENKANEKRLKGIKAEFVTPTTLEALVLDPDTTLYTAGFAPEQRQIDVTGQLVISDGVQSLVSDEAQDAAVSDFLDRIWVVEKVTHSYSESGLSTSGTCYSPIKNRFPRQNSSSDRNDAISDRNGVNPGSGIPPELAGSSNEAIYNAIEAYKGRSTSAGPDGGNQACVWAINEALREAGIDPPWGNTDYVPTVEAYLESNAASIDPADAQPGDIVIASGQYHIGVVDGSNSVISNSSSAANFRWQSNINFDDYYGGPSRIYRLP